MVSTIVHPPNAELARFAVTREPGAGRFEWAREHIASGCEACAAFVQEFRNHVSGERDETRCAPKDWVRPRRILRVEGARVGMLADTKLVCGAGPFELDVLVREYERPHKLEFTGQVTRADQVHEPVQDLPLALLDAEAARIVRSARTDEFGEFGFDAPAEGPFGLRLGEFTESPCVLVWSGEE